MKLLKMKNYKLVSHGFRILSKALNFWRIRTVDAGPNGRNTKWTCSSRSSK